MPAPPASKHKLPDLVQAPNLLHLLTLSEVQDYQKFLDEAAEFFAHSAAWTRWRSVLQADRSALALAVNF